MRAAGCAAGHTARAGAIHARRRRRRRCFGGRGEIVARGLQELRTRRRPDQKRVGIGRARCRRSNVIRGKRCCACSRSTPSRRFTHPVALRPCASAARTIVNISSDAAVNAYAGWGGYGGSKAALEHMSRILAKELEGSGVRVHVIDPGDMNTEMHALAEPGVDLSHLPDPSTVAPARPHPGAAMSAAAMLELDFKLPPQLEAREPAELRANGRDDVRMLVSQGDDATVHAHFRELPRFLAPGDLLVLNTRPPCRRRSPRSARMARRSRCTGRRPCRPGWR